VSFVSNSRVLSLACKGSFARARGFGVCVCDDLCVFVSWRVRFLKSTFCNPHIVACVTSASLFLRTFHLVSFQIAFARLSLSRLSPNATQLPVCAALHHSSTVTICSLYHHIPTTDFHSTHAHRSIWLFVSMCITLFTVHDDLSLTHKHTTRHTPHPRSTISCQHQRRRRAPSALWSCQCAARRRTGD
jgi:hypothetical protein